MKNYELLNTWYGHTETYICCPKPTMYYGKICRRDDMRAWHHKTGPP